MSFLEIANGNIMYLLAILVIVFVLVQSVIFLIRALREARRIGMEQGRIKKVITSSAIFSVVPSLPIIISLFALDAPVGHPRCPGFASRLWGRPPMSWLLRRARLRDSATPTCPKRRRAAVRPSRVLPGL